MKKGVRTKIYEPSGRATNPAALSGTLTARYIPVANGTHTLTNSVIYQDASNRIGIQLTLPTAWLHLPAGTATSGTQPLKFTTGVLSSTFELGAIEFTGDVFYASVTGARRVIALQNNIFTSTYVPYTGASGELTTVSGFNFSGTVLTAPAYKTGGTGGNGYVEFTTQSSAPGTPTNAVRVFVDNTNRLSWKMTSGFVATHDAAGLSADRVFTWPNVTGNVQVASGLSNNRIIVSSGGNYTENAALTAAKAIYTDGSGLPTVTANYHFDGTALIVGGTAAASGSRIQATGGFINVRLALGGSFYAWMDNATGAHRAQQNLTAGADLQTLRATGSAGSEAYSATMTILNSNGNVGIGSVTSPTAKIHILAGTATASTAPLKFNAGTNLTTAEAGAVEYDGTNFFATNSTAVRGTVPVIRPLVSGAGTLTLTATYTHYVYTGAGATTWTMMALSGNTNAVVFIRNRGGGTITLNSSGGANDFFQAAAVNTLSILAGASLMLIHDGTYFLTE